MSEMTLKAAIEGLGLWVNRAEERIVALERRDVRLDGEQDPDIPDFHKRLLISNLKRLKKDAFYLCQLFGWGKTRAHEFWEKYDG